jgi:hypothetical protein
MTRLKVSDDSTAPMCVTPNVEPRRATRAETLYNSEMRFFVVYVGLLIAAAATQNAPSSSPAAPSSSATVPMTADHNRIVIDVSLALADGTSKRVRGWVDAGNPELWMSQAVAESLGLAVSCNGEICSAKPPKSIVIGDMTIPLTDVNEARIARNSATASTIFFAGMKAGINIPSTILRRYDVLIDFPDHKFTISRPGAIRFKGTSSKIQVTPGSGLIQIPSQIENKKYSFALDLGRSISLLSGEVFEKLAGAHPDWPHMTGAIGPANVGGTQDELTLKLMRLDRAQFGSLFLIDVPVAELSETKVAEFKSRAGSPSAGALGADVLQNYRVGLDYAHSLVYFDIGRTFKFPEFDVVGLILRPEDDGRFTIIGVANFDEKPSVLEVQAGDHFVAIDGIPTGNSTLGQVWTMLGGSPGQERQLTLERAGKQFTVIAKVQHFLGEAPEDDQSKKKSSKNN